MSGTEPNEISIIDENPIMPENYIDQMNVSAIGHRGFQSKEGNFGNFAFGQLDNEVNSKNEFSLSI